MGHSAGFEDVLQRVELSALLAVVAQGTAVELQHLPAACLLMQAVDILGDDSLQFSLGLQLCQLVVGRVGLGIGTQELAAVKTEEFLRVLLVKGVAEDGLRWVVVLLMIQPVYAAEIRDSGFRADTGATEKDDVVGPIHHFLQFADLFLHCNNLPSHFHAPRGPKLTKEQSP